MTCNSSMVSIFRHGINNDNIGPIAKASFEETPEMFLRAAKHGELDPMRGISSNVMCGQTGYYGTSSFGVYLDMDEMIQHNESQKWEDYDENELIQKGFGDFENPNDECSISNIAIQNNAENLQSADLGDDNDYDIDF